MADQAETLKIIGEIGKISLQPGDVMVITSPVSIGVDACHRMIKQVTAIFPGHQVIFLDSGVKIEVARTASARRVYLDLDGVMADFDAHFPATFGLDHRGMADDDMWSTINGHPSYFRDMPPCAGAVEFFRSIEHLAPIILTACPKSNYPHVAGQKREWVREHLSATATILPVMGGRHKPLFMHAPGDILVDDWEKNTAAWTAAGGVAILHRDFGSTASALLALLAGGGNG